MEKFFEGVYSAFLLHDLYGKIVPGTIVLASVALAGDPTFSNLIALLAGPYSIGWLFFVGLAWVVGFSLQTLRIDWTPEMSDPITRYSRAIKFYSKAVPYQRHQLQRYSLVHDATSNSSRALFVSIAIFMIYNFAKLPDFLFANWQLLTAEALVATSLYFVSNSYLDKKMNFIKTCVDDNE